MPGSDLPQNEPITVHFTFQVRFLTTFGFLPTSSRSPFLTELRFLIGLVPRTPVPLVLVRPFPRLAWGLCTSHSAWPGVCQRLTFLPPPRHLPVWRHGRLSARQAAAGARGGAVGCRPSRVLHRGAPLQPGDFTLDPWRTSPPQPPPNADGQGVFVALKGPSTTPEQQEAVYKRFPEWSPQRHMFMDAPQRQAVRAVCTPP